MIIAAAGWAESPNSLDELIPVLLAILVVLNLLIFAAALAIWRFIHRGTLRHGQFTVRAMFSLTALLLVPMVFFILSAPAMYYYSIYTVELFLGRG